jgi:hypothetical protein
MRVLIIASLCSFLLVAAVPQKGKKAADVQIVETKAIREIGKITVDGKVRVTAEKPLHGLVIVFDFRSPEKEVVTSQKAEIDDETMDTGKEGVFHSEMADSARAVRYTVRAFDSHEKELRVANPGPYPIE